MNVKSMLVGFLIAVVASTGTYFLLPPRSDAEASDCATRNDVDFLTAQVITTVSEHGLGISRQIQKLREALVVADVIKGG